jgi:nucleoside-diphosphate-sugar epimerase
MYLFVDVRDVAQAHIRAMELPEASGQRFMLVGGRFSNKRIADIIRELYPELQDKLPLPELPDDFPENYYSYDVSKSRRMLGMEYKDLQTCVKDAVDAMIGKSY